MNQKLFRAIVPQPVRRALRNAKAWAGFEPRFLRLRRRGLRAVTGCGLEIGAFEHPAPVPRYCQVTYVDVISREEAQRRFPEIDPARLVQVDHLVDLDRDGLSLFPDGSQDFAIACHVIEHVANPGRFVAELVRVLRTGGRLIIAAPDREWTFDRARPLTSLAVLECYFSAGRAPVSPTDYQDILDYVHTEYAASRPEVREAELARYHQRREHLSVWTSESFREFLVAAFGWSKVRMTPEYEVFSKESRFEYFGVWIRR